MKILVVLSILFLAALNPNQALAFNYVKAGPGGTCPAGYQLGRDGKFCFEGNVDNGQTLYVNNGSCPAGYAPGRNGRFCFPQK